MNKLVWWETDIFGEFYFWCRLNNPAVYSKMRKDCIYNHTDLWILDIYNK